MATGFVYDLLGTEPIITICSGANAEKIEDAVSEIKSLNKWFRGIVNERKSIISHEYRE